MSATPSHIARYTVVQPIAAGGMGEVFLARDEQLDRLVAIKLLREGFDNDELRGRFEEEARNVAKLTHPNIVTIYEYGAHDGRPYIAMEYVAGHSLAELIRHKVPLSVARRVRLIEEVCSGLGHAHKAHIVHRDVKPANLMVTTSGTMKVLDFGIAKLRGTDRTQKGMLVGTVNYMSPEQITGKPVDHRSDIFAVGAVLQEILTYEQAFKGDLTTAMFIIVHGEPEPLAARCPGLDPAVQSVVSRCLAKDPEERYQDLGLLKRDLARLRRPLEEDDSDAPDTLVPLDAEKTIVFKLPTPPSGAEGRAAGPDTRRALGTALASGEAAIARGQFESAVRHAEQALALESSNVSARDLLARAQQARDAARVASAIGRAREALDADRIDDAKAALVAAGEVAPSSDTVRALSQQVEQRAADLARLQQTIFIARQRLDEGDFAQAKNLAETVVVIRPDDSELRRLREQIDQAAADDASRREEEAQRAAEAERANRITSLLDKARRATEELLDRHDAVSEVLRLDPRNADAAALLVELDAAIAEDVRHRGLDEALAAGEALLERGQYDAAAAKAHDVAQARPGDARAKRLLDAVAAARQKREVTREALARAESLAQSGRSDEAIAALAVLDPRETEVSALLARLQRERSAEARRRRIAAVGARVRSLASNRGVLAGLGAAAALALAVWLWPAAPDPSSDPVPEGALVEATNLPLSDWLVRPKGRVESRTAALELLPEGVGAPERPLDGPGSKPVDPPDANQVEGPGSKPLDRPGPNPPARDPEKPALSDKVPEVPKPVPGRPVEPPLETVKPRDDTPKPPTEPPVDVQRQVDEREVRELLGVFGRAYQEKDLGRMKAAWPTMSSGDETSYRNAFRSNRSLRWTLLSADIQSEGQAFLVRCSVRVELDEFRSRPEIQNRTYLFRFERRANGWTIADVDFRGSSR